MPADYDGHLTAWDVPGGKRRWQAKVLHRALSLENREPVLSPNGTMILAVAEDCLSAVLYDATTGEKFGTLAGHKDRLNSALFSPDGKRIPTASSDGTASLWDAATRRPAATLAGHTKYVDAASFSADGRRAVTVSRDDTTGRKVVTLEDDAGRGGFKLRFTDKWAALSPDGDRRRGGGRASAMIHLPTAFGDTTVGGIDSPN